jgi:FMN phosphatase YigB (HAD superfamily)
MVHGVPEPAAVPRDRPSDRPSDRPRPRAVLFDFHGTLAQVEEPVAWVLAAAGACGAALDRPRATALADRLVAAGRAGGPLPARIPPHLAEVWADRDLSPQAHRAAYTGLIDLVDVDALGPAPGGFSPDGFADALYDRVREPFGWVAYADTVSTLGALRAAGIPVAVISNVGFDVRPIADALGFGALVDTYVLSYEVGHCKPDPGIFLHACAALGVEPPGALMVGDTPADAGATRIGCPALIVPAHGPGEANGLAAVLDLVGCGPDHCTSENEHPCAGRG